VFYITGLIPSTVSKSTTTSKKVSTLLLLSRSLFLSEEGREGGAFGADKFGSGVPHREACAIFGRIYVNILYINICLWCDSAIYSWVFLV